MNTNISPIVRQIVDRCHVGDPMPDVMRYVMSRISPEAMRDPSKRHQIAALVWSARRVHRENRDLYRYVRTGRG